MPEVLCWKTGNYLCLAEKFPLLLFFLKCLPFLTYLPPAVTLQATEPAFLLKTEQNNMHIKGSLTELAFI